LFKIVQALGGLGLGFGPTERGQQHCRENGDDGDDHEQFNERESAGAGALDAMGSAGGRFIFKRLHFFCGTT
jgi:hypothetical protein